MDDIIFEVEAEYNRTFYPAFARMQKRYNNNKNGKYFLSRDITLEEENDLILLNIRIKPQIPSLGYLGYYSLFTGIVLAFFFGYLFGGWFNLYFFSIGVLGFIIFNIPNILLTKGFLFYMLWVGLKKHGYSGNMELIR